MRSLDQVSYCPDFLFKACRLRLITCRPVQPITDSVTKIPQADLRCSGGFLGVFLDCSDFSAGVGPASPESPLLWHLGQFLSWTGEATWFTGLNATVSTVILIVCPLRLSVYRRFAEVCYFPTFSYPKTQAGFTFARIRRCQWKVFYEGILH